jgi:hypothetical protein
MAGSTAQSRLLDLTEMSLSAGPLELREPAFSFEGHSLVLHPPAAISEAILAVPGSRLLQPAEPSWNAWKARWEQRERYIDLDINALEVEPGDCGGLSLAWENTALNTHCLLSDILMLWESVLSRCPGVWLHDLDCRLWSPGSFSKEVLAFQEGTEGPTWRQGWGTL